MEWINLSQALIRAVRHGLSVGLGRFFGDHRDNNWKVPVIGINNWKISL